MSAVSQASTGLASVSRAPGTQAQAQAGPSTGGSGTAHSTSAQRAGTSRMENPATPLKSITSSTGFTFPPIWSFPPFFTLQPNPSTLSHQLSLWSNLVLAWATHDRIFSVNCDAQDAGEVFNNKGIKRKLLPQSLRRLMSHMTEEGHAIADPPKQASVYLLYWRKPEEWGTMIYDWVMDHGLASSIMTFYEITDGDMSDNTEFRQLPVPLLRKALDTLVKKGKAQIIRGEGPDSSDGARFF